MDVREADPDTLSALSEAERQKSVVIVQDAFTSHFDAQVVLDMADLFRRLGFRPWVAPYLPNGKPLHVHGYLDQFAVAARKNAAMLSGLAETGIALVGLDPSMSLTYRSEYKQFLRNVPIPDILLPQEWLAKQDLESEAIATQDYVLLPHCTERMNVGTAVSQWVDIFERSGLTLRILQAGCCGMAGAYGHIAENRQTSEAIYASSWQRLIRDPKNRNKVLATGYSCRCQAKLMDGTVLLHPVQALLAAHREFKGTIQRSAVPHVDQVAMAFARESA